MTKNRPKYFDAKSLIVVTCSALLVAISPVHANPSTVSVLTSTSRSSRIDSEYASLIHPVVMPQADTVAQHTQQENSSAQITEECNTGKLSCTMQNAFTNAFSVVPLHECWADPSRSACARAAVLLGIENPSARILTGASIQIAEQLDDEIEKAQKDNKGTKDNAQKFERKARHEQRMQVLDFQNGVEKGINDIKQEHKELGDWYREWQARRRGQNAVRLNSPKQKEMENRVFGTGGWDSDD